MKRITAHDLAKKLLALPDDMIVFDGLGKNLQMVEDGEHFHNPYMGTVTSETGSETPVVVIELE
jgi:hypothetical protein